MYFYKQKGRQCLDLTGNFILTHNDRLIKARVSSAAPTGGVKHARFIEVADLGLFGKCRALFHVARFIFGKPRPLTDAAADMRSGKE